MKVAPLPSHNYNSWVDLSHDLTQVMGGVQMARNKKKLDQGFKWLETNELGQGFQEDERKKNPKKNKITRNLETRLFAKKAINTQFN